MQLATKSTKARDIKRSWHLIDVKGKILGRAATDVAQVLMGKAKPYFVRHLDCGDYVVVVNASHVVTTGHKEEEKMYGRYSGYPGGLKKKPLWLVRKEKPTEPMRLAVYGMLPKNKLRDRLMTRLFLYPEEDHPYNDKFTSQSS